MLKVLIATGGTGGHLFPSQQLADQLEDCEVVFAGHKLTTSPFFNRKVPFHEIASASSKKKGLTLLKGIFQSLKLLLRFRPDVVVGFGSFHSFPVLMAAVILCKKIVLFEPNCSLGKVNRFFAPFAKKVALQFPIPHEKAAYVPLLPWKPLLNKKNERDPNRKTILVFGGSQGAAFINKVFCEAAARLTFPFQVIHLTGKEDPEIYCTRPETWDFEHAKTARIDDRKRVNIHYYSVPALVKPFEEDMASLYRKADFAVCRCGANTTAELIRYNIPAVVIPYPYAHDHQRKNGEFLIAKKGARMLDQKEATPERLCFEIEELNAHLEQHKAALREIFFPKTVELGDLVRTVGGDR